MSPVPMLSLVASLAILIGCQSPTVDDALHTVHHSQVGVVSQTGSSRSQAPGNGLPAGVADPPPGTGQLVTVLTTGRAASTGTLQAWQRTENSWRPVLGPVSVRVGTNGVGPTHEGLGRTPIGTFSIPSTFGRLPNPGTAMAYHHVTDADWWVSDPHSPAYNTFRHCAPGSCSFDEADGENLGKVGPSYDYAAVIGYNVNPIEPGAGSAFFVHVDAGIPSQGCVETPREAVIALLRWLNPAAHPEITIGYHSSGSRVLPG